MTEYQPSPRFHIVRLVLASVIAIVASPLAGAQPVKVMPIGDSITFGAWNPFAVRSDVPGGYRRQLAVLLTASGHSFDYVGHRSDNPAPGMDPDHNGNSGWRTDQMLSSLCDWLVKDPDVVLLKAGTNDVLQQRPVPDALRDLENLIVKILMSRPDRRVFVATLIPIRSNWGGIPEAVHTANADAYNEGVREAVTRLSGEGFNVSLVDMDARVVLTHEVPAKRFFQPGDGVHPGQAGYDQLGELWHAAIIDAGGLAISPQTGVPAKRTGLGAAVASPSGISLSWTSPPSDEEAQEVWCRELSSAAWRKIAILPPGVSGHTAIGLATAGRSYRFAINAVNPNGSSGWSNLASVTSGGNSSNIAHCKPSMASSEYSAAYSAAKGNDGLSTSLWASTGIGFHWWQVDLVQPKRITRVELMTRQDGSGVEEQRRNFEIIASNDPAFGTHVVLTARGSAALAHKATHTASPGVQETFRHIRARKTVQESFSFAELRVFGESPVLAPSVPENLAVDSVSHDRVRIIWAGTPDGATAYRIERRKAGEEGFFTVATTTSPDMHEDAAGLDALTAYTYRVSAANEAGESLPSHEITVTTLPAPLSFDAWASSFPDLLNLPESDQLPGADPNGDGVTNLLAYAFGLDPLLPFDSAMTPRICYLDQPGDRTLVFRFVRNLAAADPDYRIETSSLDADQTWIPLPATETTASRHPVRPDLEVVTLAIDPLAGPHKRFFRLRVELPAGD